MAQAKVSIKIKGWQKVFIMRSLILQQPFNGHHTFEIVVSIPQTLQLTNELLRDILGEKATLSISTQKDRVCKFKGFVDQINTSWTNSGRVLNIKGFSPSIFMDTAPQFRTFSKNTLGKIIQRLKDSYSGGKLPSITQKGNNPQVDFTMQSQETDYRFLCRLADNYGSVFFYNGEKLYFGDWEKTGAKEIKIEWGKTGNHFVLSQNLAPLNFQLKGYNLLNNTVETHNSEQKSGNLGAVGKSVIDKSSIYPNTKVHLNYVLEDKKDLKPASQRIMARQYHELLTLSGSSDNPNIQIGSQVTINGNKDLLGEEKYRVIEVTHQVSSDNAYQNHFTAVPVGYPFPIRMQQGRSPMCGPLNAIVKKHDDPKGLGRVQVQFVGDSEESLSPWLRVIVPYAKNGGLYFLPEKEDKVLVFFEDFNPEKSPFVLGSFYHGQSDAQQWKDTNNQKKGICTQKIALLFDDKTGKLTIEAEEIEIKAKKEMNLDGGKQLTQKATRIDLNP